MKKFWKHDFGGIILILLLMAITMPFREARKRNIRVSYVFVAIAILLFIVRVVYTTVMKGH